jgi:hypothetical protein
MTLAQKKARENFKKAIAYRKKTGCSLKQAFAYVKTGKVGAYKVIQKGEKKNAKVTKVLEQKRTKTGKFVSLKRVAGVKKKIGNVKREYQLQRLSDDKILTYDLGTGQEWFLDSPDRGYMFTEDEANYRKGIFANKGIQVRVIKYNRDWWKVSGVKKAAKKKAVTKHKDIKSHNVNIRVVSGINKQLNAYKELCEREKSIKDGIIILKESYKKVDTPQGKKHILNMLKQYNKGLKAVKKQKTIQKTLI